MSTTLKEEGEGGGRGGEGEEKHSYAGVLFCCFLIVQRLKVKGNDK